MEKSFCKTCFAKNLPDVVEPCISCKDKSNWKGLEYFNPKLYQKAEGYKSPSGTKVLNSNAPAATGSWLHFRDKEG
ncbi:MAG: hypothetical protein Q8911_09305 [Bacillota bacterium]|nr:hypothetical protein [Bacillota bacterium]